MRKTQPGSESFVKLEQEFSVSLNEMRVGLLAVLEHANEEISQRFSDVYLGMSGGVAKNLTDLAHDFSQFKDLQNAGRRGDVGAS
jgi:predicted ATP-dependent serine protease